MHTKIDGWCWLIRLIVCKWKRGCVYQAHCHWPSNQCMESTILLYEHLPIYHSFRSWDTGLQTGNKWTERSCLYIFLHSATHKSLYLTELRENGLTADIMDYWSVIRVIQWLQFTYRISEEIREKCEWNIFWNSENIGKIQIFWKMSTNFSFWQNMWIHRWFYQILSDTVERIWSDHEFVLNFSGGMKLNIEQVEYVSF